MIFIRLLTLFAFAVSTTAAVHAPKAVVATHPVATSLTAALNVRGGGVVDGDMYVKGVQGAIVVYGVLSASMPALMVTMHFKDAATEQTDYWIRGMGLYMIATAYLLGKSGDDAVKIGLVISFLTGVILPWNAKFGYASKLNTKPIHLFPELLLLGYTVAGLLAL
jgi:hypothetical protein